MVRIEKIYKRGRYIYAICFPEGDMSIGTPIVVDAESFDLVNSPVNSYTHHAARRIKDLANNKVELPESATAKWY